MKLKYVNQPKLINSPTNIKGMVEEIIANGEIGRWVEIRSTEGKTDKDYTRAYASYTAAKKRYQGLKWSIHKAKTCFVVVAQKTQ